MPDGHLVAILAALDPVAVNGPRGSALADWWPLYGFAGVFVVIIVAAFVAGGTRRAEHGDLMRIPAGLERASGVPAWAATTLLFSIYGLAVAGFGFYTDVEWHVGLGRDDDLFTSPHTAILLGLVMIACAAPAGAIVAAQRRRRDGAHIGPFRLPWSTVPLLALGTAALIGFPIDELWHRRFGVDVTMWSPPHLIMILAASFSGLASWLVLAEAGVRPAGRWGRGLHVVAGALTLQGLSSLQGEFSFGVPQWQQLYHPVLICLAAGFALVAIRIVHGPWWALGIATGILVVQLLDGLDDGGPVKTRLGALYIGSAIAVELAARVFGTDRRLRFAIASGFGVLAMGLPVEWFWNQGAHQPWTAALLPEAVLVGGLAALAAAVLGAAAAGAISRGFGGNGAARTVPAAAVLVALLGVGVALGLPGPRRVGDVRADVRLEWTGREHARIHVTLDPPDAAVGARWFTAGSWQWGGRTIAHMERTGDGTYVADEPLLMTGRAKSLLRLHRGAEMMAVAIRLPADPKYDLAEVPAEDRSARFVAEQRFLQREAGRPAGWFAVLVYALAVGLAVMWIGSFAIAAHRIGRTQTTPADDEGAPLGAPS